MRSTDQHYDDTDFLLASDGELPAPRRAAIDAHVARCTTCRTRLDEIRATLTVASHLYESQHDLPDASPLDSRMRLESALRAAAAESDRSRLGRFAAAARPSLARPAVGIAAAVLLLAIWLGSSRTTSHAPAAEHAGGPLPVATLTPGSVSALTAAELCAGIRPSRLVTDQSRRRVLRNYGMEHVPSPAYELDALITPELGGTTEPENLWPQRYASPVWNARIKDELERLLPEMVCRNELTLAQAQRDLALDWVAAYKRYFRTETPLLAHLGSASEADDDLVFSPPDAVVARAEAFAPTGVLLIRH